MMSAKSYYSAKEPWYEIEYRHSLNHKWQVWREMETQKSQVKKRLEGLRKSYPGTWFRGTRQIEVTYQRKLVIN